MPIIRSMLSIVIIRIRRPINPDNCKTVKKLLISLTKSRTVCI